MIRNTYSLALYMLVIGGLAFGCAEGPNSTPVVPELLGMVVGLDRAPIVGATVTVAGTDLTTQTDYQGYFQVGGLTDQSSVNLEVNAEGFSTVFRRVQVTAEVSTTIQITLAPAIVETVVLDPAAPATTLQMSRATGTVTYSIPPNGLADENGVPATGPVEAAWTYWLPGDDLRSMHAPLFAANPDGTLPNSGPIPLVTVGIIELQFRQGNTPINVAPGKALDITARVPEKYRADMEARANSAKPRLYVVNMETGYWEEQTDRYTYDVATGVLTGKVERLTGTNIDIPPDPPGGSPPGCLEGSIETACGSPLANAQVTLEVERAPGNYVPYSSVLWDTTDAAGTFNVTTARSGPMDVRLTVSYRACPDDATPEDECPLYEAEFSPIRVTIAENGQPGSCGTGNALAAVMPDDFHLPTEKFEGEPCYPGMDICCSLDETHLECLDYVCVPEVAQ